MQRKKHQEEVYKEKEKVSRYTALFEKVKIEIETKGEIVQVLLKENILNES